MGSIGQYKYPDHTIDEAIDIVEIINDENLTDKEVLATRLDHKTADSGAYRNKLTTLRRYGLIPQRGDIALTRLAERIVMPDPATNEREQAIGEAVENVDLLARLYDQLGYSEPDDNFFLQVAQVSGADRSEAKNKAPRIERLYKSGLRYVKIRREEDSRLERPSTGEEDGAKRDQEDEQPPPSPDADATLTTPDGTVIHIKNKATFNAALAILDSLGAEEYGITADNERNGHPASK